jgi:hypothetical protein
LEVGAVGGCTKKAIMMIKRMIEETAQFGWRAIIGWSFCLAFGCFIYTPGHLLGLISSVGLAYVVTVSLPLSLVSGTLIGAFQWLILDAHWKRNTVAWLLVTLTGWSLGRMDVWIIVLIAYSRSGRNTSGVEYGVISPDHLWLGIVFYVLMGLICGVCQWPVLRRRTSLAKWWIVISVTAWALGAITYGGIGMLHIGWLLELLVAPIVSGAVIGLVTGAGLRLVLNPVRQTQRLSG